MRATHVKGVLFDFDGTLTRPGALDFPALRAEIGSPPDQTILDYISSLDDEEARRRALGTLHAFEERAAAESVPNEGAEDTVRGLAGQGLVLGILTRNSRASLDRAFRNFGGISEELFAVVITRDDHGPIKPDPESVRSAARRMGLAPEELMVVGDYRHEIEAGNAAGSWTVVVHGGEEPEWLSQSPPDYRIRRLAELPELLSRHQPLPDGKLRPELFGPVLDVLRSPSLRAEEVVVGPGVGEDAASLLTGGAEIVVLKSDPITFVTDDPGAYLVAVNANDVVCCGAEPRWLLATAVFPSGTTARTVSDVTSGILAACTSHGILLVGGHVEISPAVNRMVVSGTLAGTMERAELADKRTIRPGDILLMTKTAGLEGTAVLAGECRALLLEKGTAEATVRRAEALVSRLSVVPEARIARGVCRAMHDVTEGGVATALRELAEASGASFRIDLDVIPVLRETRAVCDALGVDPLGLIGSGALLIAAAPEKAGALLDRLEQAEISAVKIGEVTASPFGEGPAVAAHRDGEPAELPAFEVDEIARFFASRPSVET